MNEFCINGRFLTQKITGEQRYAIEMVKALDSIVDKNWSILVPNDKIINKLDLKNIQIKQVGLLKGHLWEQLEVPYYSKGKCLINFCDMAPIIKSNQIVFIHDMQILSHPEHYTFKFRKWHEFVEKKLVHKVVSIFTVSSFSKHEIMKYWHVPSEKISVLPCACSPELQKNVFLKDFLAKNKINHSKKILLAVSSMQRNKNFSGIIKSLQYLDTNRVELIIAGGINRKLFSIDNTDLKNINSKFNNIKFVGYVSDEELITLYKFADCFIFPSFYEGFGIPPIEAMYNGCPVVVSNTSALPETCGNAALYCNPYDPKDIATKINLILNNNDLAEKYSMLGLNKVKEYSWVKNAEKFYSFIQRNFN